MSETFGEWLYRQQSKYPEGVCTEEEKDMLRGMIKRYDDGLGEITYNRNQVIDAYIVAEIRIRAGRYNAKKWEKALREIRENG